jgi:hypothetical protein
MASKRHNRTSKKRSRSGYLKKSLSRGYYVAKTTTKKIAPKVKAGLTKVGSEVKVVAKNTVPVIEKVSDRLLGFFNKTKKNLNMKSQSQA